MKRKPGRGGGGVGGLGADRSGCGCGCGCNERSKLTHQLTYTLLLQYISDKCFSV